MADAVAALARLAPATTVVVAVLSIVLVELRFPSNVDAVTVPKAALANPSRLTMLLDVAAAVALFARAAPARTVATPTVSMVLVELRFPSKLRADTVPKAILAEPSRLHIELDVAEAVAPAIAIAAVLTADAVDPPTLTTVAAAPEVVTSPVKGPACLALI
jgi:hypothetical protein